MKVCVYENLGTKFYDICGTNKIYILLFTIHEGHSDITDYKKTGDTYLLKKCQHILQKSVVNFKVLKDMYRYR